MKNILPVLLVFATGCAAAISTEPTLNERTLAEQRERLAAGEDVYQKESNEPTTDLGANFGAGSGSVQQFGAVSGGSNFKNDFKGEGQTDRSGRLTATVQAVVEDVLPNGVLFVRGRKVVTINSEDQHVELTGFVRPDDIRINNTVVSSLMADAQIRYVGKGVIGDKQRGGWGARLIDFVWPF